MFLSPLFSNPNQLSIQKRSSLGKTTGFSVVAGFERASSVAPDIPQQWRRGQFGLRALVEGAPLLVGAPQKPQNKVRRKPKLSVECPCAALITAGTQQTAGLMRANDGPGYLVRKVFLKNPESESQEFFISTTGSASSLGKELGRALRFPGQSSLLPWAPAPEAILNLPVHLVHMSPQLQAHGVAWGWKKLLGVTRAQVVLVPAPKAVHCSPLSRTGINQAEEKERLPGPCHWCPSHGAQSHTHLSVIHQGQQAWPLHHFPQLKV